MNGEEQSAEDRLREVDGEDEPAIENINSAAASADWQQHAWAAAPTSPYYPTKAGVWDEWGEWSYSTKAKWQQGSRDNAAKHQYNGSASNSSWQQQPPKRGGGAWKKGNGKSSYPTQSSWEGTAGASKSNTPQKNAKGAGKGSWARHAGSAAYSRGGSGKKFQCQFTIGIEEEPSFKVVRKVLGPHGQFVKRIADTTAAKLRLRGRGSGFVEGPAQIEADDPLMLCVSVPDAEGYSAAKQQVTALLEDVYKQYLAHCKAEGIPAPSKELRVNIHEGPREGSY